MNYTPQPGDRVHWLESGVTFSTKPGDITGYAGAISRRGETLTLTSEILEANADRAGVTIFHLAEDEARQVDLYGRILLRRGPWPDSEDVYVRGSQEWAEAREKARRAAWAIPDEQKQAEALRAVHERFGAAPVTSRTFADSSTPARQVEAEIREGQDDAYL
jgi:hypothetical protein